MAATTAGAASVSGSAGSFEEVVGVASWLDLGRRHDLASVVAAVAVAAVPVGD